MNYSITQKILHENLFAVGLNINLQHPTYCGSKISHMHVPCTINV